MGKRFKESVRKRIVTEDKRNLIKRIFGDCKWEKPFFSGIWLNPDPPENGELIRRVKNVFRTIEIYRIQGLSYGYYHLNPLEYRMGRGELNIIKGVLASLWRGGVMRGNVREGIRREVIEYLLKKNQHVEGLDPEILSRIAVQYTAGYGVLEHFLKDNRVQDLYIDAPVGTSPIYLTVGGLEAEGVPSTCVTNAVMTPWEAEKTLTKIKVITGKSFSESKPVLEADLKELSSRLTVVGPPLSQEGLSFALRRHSGEPWTLLRLIYAGSITPESAGFLSFLMEGRATMMVVGSRGAGKTSLLGALLFEIPRSQRIITIEDTPELPGDVLRKEGYKVLSLQVRSSTTAFSEEMTAEDALRVALRLGESVLVMGEVRGEEMKTLYEAMSAGVAGSAVLGTLHADSPSGTFKRVVYDRGISPSSFTATDVVIISGLIKPLGENVTLRRMSRISEVVKDNPGKFNDLFLYSRKRDGVLPTKDYKHSSSIIKRIADEWGITYEEALKNIDARAEIRRAVVKKAMLDEREDILSSKWVPIYNEWFNEIISDERKKGGVDYNHLVRGWMKRFEMEVLRI